MKNLKQKLILFVLFLSTIFSLTPALALADAKSDIQCGANNAAGAACGAKPKSDVNSTIKTIVNLLSVFGGIAAVIMVIVGGFRYITSGGNDTSVTSAKNTILYAIIGLVVVALAQLIVRFTLSKLTNG